MAARRRTRSKAKYHLTERQKMIFFPLWVLAFFFAMVMYFSH